MGWRVDCKARDGRRRRYRQPLYQCPPLLPTPSATTRARTQRGPCGSHTQYSTHPRFTRYRGRSEEFARYLCAESEHSGWAGGIFSAVSPAVPCHPSLPAVAVNRRDFGRRRGVDAGWSRHDRQKGRRSSISFQSSRVSKVPKFARFSCPRCVKPEGYRTSDHTHISSALVAYHRPKSIHKPKSEMQKGHCEIHPRGAGKWGPSPRPPRISRGAMRDDEVRDMLLCMIHMIPI